MQLNGNVRAMPRVRVVSSTLVGLILPVVLAVVVSGGGTEPIITGVVLLALTLGWTLMAW